MSGTILKMTTRTIPVILMLITASHVLAGTITTTTEASYMDWSGSPICTASGTSGASCGPFAGGSESISSAAYYSTFSGLVSTQNYTPGADYPASASGSASIVETESEFLVVTGNTGTGTLTLNFTSGAHGSENGYESDSSMTFSTNYGSVPWYDQIFFCEGGDVCTWYESNFAIVIPFTFNVPFLFTETFGLSASSTNMGLGDGAYAQASIQMTNFSVVNSDDNPVQAILSDPSSNSSVPEPTTMFMSVCGLVIMIGGLRRK